MRWEWDESGDQGVADLWNLRGELSTTRKVVYTKWYRGRATYFSRPLFVAMLRRLNPEGVAREALSAPARRILDILEGESPLSTKELKRLSALKGRANEAVYERALRELWQRLLIVAFGEVDEGAFPSLAVGATSVIFEELYAEGQRLAPMEAERRILATLPEGNLFLKHFRKLEAEQARTGGSAAPVPPGRKGTKRREPRRGAESGVIRFEDL